eukprot:29661_1
MSPVTTTLIIFGLGFCTLFTICLLLLSKSLHYYCKNKHQIKIENKAPIKLSLVSMSLFTTSLFLYVIHFVMCMCNAHNGQAEDLIKHDLINNSFYIMAIFTALYVWILRLEGTFHNSAHGYPVKYLRSIRIFYFVVVALGLFTLVLHVIVYFFNLSRIISAISATIFVLLFIPLFATVLCLFIHKMKQSVRLAKLIAKNMAYAHKTQMHSISKELVQLVVKFTILSVLCIASTLCTIGYVLIVMFFSSEPPMWYLFQLSLAIDDFIGFISLYCAWGSNKAYRRLCGCVHSMIVKYKGEASDSPDIVSQYAEHACSVSNVSNVVDVQVTNTSHPASNV